MASIRQVVETVYDKLFNTLGPLTGAASRVGGFCELVWRRG